MSNITDDIQTTDDHEYPELSEFLSSSGIDSRLLPTLSKALIENKYISYSSILTLNTFSLRKLGIQEKLAKQLFQHIQYIKRDDQIFLSGDSLRLAESHYSYLISTSKEINDMLQFASGRFGMRSKTLIELFGPHGSGKTNWCMTAATIAMLPPDQNGWGSRILYINSRGGFDYHRFVNLADNWGLSEENIKKQLLLFDVDNFDELELAIDLVINDKLYADVKMIIIDSLIEPLSNQYPIHEGVDGTLIGMRQRHLKSLLDRLRNYLKMKDVLFLCTNLTRPGYGAEDEYVPMGGYTLAYATEIRIELKELTVDEEILQQDSLVAKLFTQRKQTEYAPHMARIVDCSFLPSREAYFMNGPAGIVSLQTITNQLE